MYLIIAVTCSYDTDVFEQNDVPIVDWKVAESRIHTLGISRFLRLPVKSSIEDWLLDDVAGLCSYLNLKQMPATLKGRNGYERMDNLFKKGHRRYVKGVQIESFIDSIDISVIRSKHQDILKDFEEILNVTIE